ncbi:sensor histidine kinase [Methylomonas methanica]|uniref:histidine kinase n=1 Tax=Methylomonas methanica (strain DSM 25384 / MC09) TaxID=857087 RepID=F9ZY85_METMM|nr:HAMP domain-containing sensor histidine kinase [Methylomonas methanica]AEF99815.1 histidine kinase [Methylomonas methanica MC09]
MKYKNLLSLKSLIVLGFATAVIPLFLGVMYAAYGLRETAELGRTINSQVFEQTKTIRTVLQKSSDIERKARLFVLLSDPALRQPYERESYESARASFKQALSDLLKLHVDNKIALLVNELSEKENLIYQQIISSETDNSFKLPIDEAFLGFRESSNVLSREFENHVEHTFNELRQLSESLEQGLLFKGAILLMLSCALVFALLKILSGSMRQLDTAIRRLGSSELQEPIEVSGPADLRYLGERLEWLRTHLIALESSKQQLMQNLAREIEQPLQHIRNGAEQLHAPIEQPTANANTDITLQMEASVDKLKTVSEQLLKYSQIQSSLPNQDIEILNMHELVETTLEHFKDALQAKSINVKKLIKPLQIEGIAEQCRGIVEELLINAIQFSPENGEIRIMLRDSGDVMELEIEDDGPGIEPDNRLQVFEPFYRGSPANNPEHGDNHGLGLAMVREYVAHHQGQIEFIDPRQDHLGARVRVQIPLDFAA